MASTYTTNLTLEKPGIGEQDGDWGATLNSNFDTIDTKLAIKDEDTMASDSASHLATQQSIKAYVDSKIATEESIEDTVGGMVTGNTETGIAVTYEDGDGTLDFVVADTTVAGDSGSTGMTPGDTLTIAGGTNVTTAMSGDTLTITSTDTNTQLTQEQVEDFVGGMLDGTETFIDVSYDDTDGNLDFVVPVKDEDAMGSNSAAHLATQQSIKAYVDGKVGATALDDVSTGDAASTLATSAGNITIDAQGDNTDIILKGTDGGVDKTAISIDMSENALVKFPNDSQALSFGSDGDVTVTHNADKGLTLNSMDISGVKSINGTDSGSGANYGQIGGNRNFVYNGDMVVCQRSNSVSGIGNGGGGYKVQDRWNIGEAGTVGGVVTMSQATESPDGFKYSLKLDCTTAESSVAADELWWINQNFEGQDLQSWNKGDAQARPVTVSFWVNATKTGTNIVQLYDGDNNRSCCQSYTVSSSDTWEFKTLNFPADTTGAFDFDTSASLQLIWYLVAGTDWTSGTLPTTWASHVAANVAVGQVNNLDSTSNNFHITGVQMELGDTATAFEYESPTANLIRCNRYYYAITSMTAYLYALNEANNYRRITISHPPMRTNTPTASLTGTITNATTQGFQYAQQKASTIYGNPAGANTLTLLSAQNIYLEDEI